jgi:predicted P-loop ATPase
VSDAGGGPGGSGGVEKPSAVVAWAALGLSLDHRHVPHPSEDNAFRILTRAAALKGRIWWDTFAYGLRTTWRSPDFEPRPVTRADVVALTVWIQGELELPRMRVQTVESALRVFEAATEFHRSAPVEWLRKLPEWDGTPRVDTMLAQWFGVEDGEYARAVARNWLIGMVARVMRPGCQLQTMPVLIGAQGAGKSRALRALGGAWFREILADVGKTDFLAELQRAWLIEVGEMSAFKRGQTARIKQIISNESDTFRAPYEAVAVAHPRQCVLVGTTNDDEFLEDSSGGRRFLPVRCGTVDVDGLERARALLFAEAFARWAEGATWWEVPLGDALAAQEDRRVRDEWEALVARHVTHTPEGYARAEPITRMTMAQVLSDVLGIPRGQWGKAEQMRVGHAMRALGWERRQIAGGERCYVAPGEDQRLYGDTPAGSGGAP